MDYLSYWSLQRRPFTNQDEQFFFSGPPQREAIAGLSYFINSDLNVAALVSSRRCGTTKLLQHLCQMRGFCDCAIELITTNGKHENTDSVYMSIAQALGYTDLDDAEQHVHMAIESAASQGLSLTWLIDQSSTETTTVARELVMDHANVSVVIGTMPISYARRVIEFGRAPMRIDLSSLSVEDSIEYVNFSLEHAGANRKLFSDNTIVRLHEIANGGLADLSDLAEYSLALAAGHQFDEATPAVVEAIHQQQRSA